MSKEDIARELMALGISILPGMAWVAPDGSCSRHAVWADTVPDNAVLDMEDDLTLAGVELQVRELWFARGAVTVAFPVFREGTGYAAAYDDVRRLWASTPRDDGPLSRPEALLAAARAAKGGG